MSHVIAATLPPPLDTGSLVTQWSWSPFAILACGGTAGWYVVSARRAHRRGRPVERWRTASFLAGSGVALLALASPIDTYAEVSFPVHMVQHLLLSSVAPPLLTLGAPIALALRASSPGTARRTSSFLSSRPMRVVANPVVGFAAMAGLPFVLHLSPLYDLALREPWAHGLEHALVLVVGAAFWWPLVDGDPAPHRPGYAARVLSLMLLLPAQGFLGLVLFSAAEPLYETYARLPAPFGPSALDDQRAAAALMWVVGTALTIGAAVTLAVRWREDEERRQRRVDDLDGSGVTSPSRRGASRSA